MDAVSAAARLLGLAGADNLAPSDVDRAWKKALLQGAHPDRGGSKEVCFKLLEARELLLRHLGGAAASAPASESGGCSFECEECFGKHELSCQCACVTCRCDAHKRRFWAMLESDADYSLAFEEFQNEVARQRGAPTTAAPPPRPSLESLESLGDRLTSIEAVLSGELPSRPTGQCASDRKRVVDEALNRLRQERRALVQEERAARQARPKRRRRQ